MSVLPQTQVGDINYDTYYIPTNTKSIVIAASSIIQPGCLFAEDQALTRFNFLKVIYCSLRLFVHNVNKVKVFY